jgi:hypothetical protein
VEQSAASRVVHNCDAKGSRKMEHYGIIGWIVLGGIAGAIAKLLTSGP